MKTLVAAAALAIAGCAAPDPMILARSDARFEQLRPGMTRDEVSAILGRPDQVMPFPLSGTLAWSYLYQDQFGYYVEHSVTFDREGRMLSRTIRRLNEGGDMR